MLPIGWCQSRSSGLIWCWTRQVVPWFKQTLTTEKCHGSILTNTHRVKRYCYPEEVDSIFSCMHVPYARDSQPIATTFLAWHASSRASPIASGLHCLSNRPSRPASNHKSLSAMEHHSDHSAAEGDVTLPDSVHDSPPVTNTPTVQPETSNSQGAQGRLRHSDMVAKF